MVLQIFRTFYPSRTFLLHFFVLNIRNKQEFRGLLPGFQVMLRSAIKSDIFISCFKLSVKWRINLKLKFSYSNSNVKSPYVSQFLKGRHIHLIPHKESFSLIEKVSSSHLTSRHAKAKWKFIFISKFLKHRYRDISNSPSMARPSEGCLRKWRF